MQILTNSGWGFSTMPANLGKNTSHLDWKRAKELLEGKVKRKIAHNTYVAERPDDAVAIVYHMTDIVTFQKDGKVVLRNGGWYTKTTMARLRHYSPENIHFNTTGREGEWGVKVGDKPSIEFKNGMTVDPSV